MSRSVEPGWYPDPLGGSRMRWHTGAEWTEDSRPKPSPADLPAPTTPPLDWSAPHGNTETPTAGAPQSGTIATAVPPAGRRSTQRTATGSRTADIVIVSFCVLLLLLVVVAFIVASTSPIPSASSGTRPTANPAQTQDSDAYERWAQWFDTQWQAGAMSTDPTRRAQVCAQWSQDRIGTAAESAAAMWGQMIATDPDLPDAGLSEAMLFDGFLRNMRQSCS